MSAEEEIDIPEAWRRAVHPRRSGISPLPPLEESGESVFTLVARRSGSGVDLDVAREKILAHPDTEAGLAELARSAEPTVAADAVRLALAPSPLRETFWYSSSLAPIDALVADRGLAHAAAAFVASCEYYCPAAGMGTPPLLRLTDARDSEVWPPGLWGGAALRLRYLLATASQEVYDDTLSALTPARAGLFRQRIVTTYLMPDMQEWVTADFGSWPAEYRGPIGWLFYSASTAEQLARFQVTQLGDFVTAYDAVGAEVAPLLAHWLGQGSASPEIRRDVLDVLTRIPTDLAFDCLLANLDLPDVLAGVRAAADRFPRRAGRMLAERRGADAIDALFVRHVGAHPDIPEAQLLPRVPEARAEAVPALLASPPWTRPPAPRAAVPASPDAARPRIVWQEDERERWSYDWKAFLADEMARHLPLALRGEAPAEFYISAPDEIVRPNLAAWKAESTWFYLQEPHVIVGKYELDALAPMLRLARTKPAVGAPLLMPYLGQEVADLMAEWLTRSRQFRPLARQWFTRHGPAAAALLIPAALGGAPADSRTAALALTRIDEDDVRAAGDTLGCRTEVEEFLQRDPLDLLPSKIPAAPKWADPRFLPQILLPGRQHALPSAATTALLRLVALSQLDTPYEGLRVIANQLDPVSLADFAWSLYRLWEIEGRPSKDAWAMNSLGYFGDDRIADRLAPLIRAWPSEGSAPRAKRGAEVLATLASDRALGHLSALARNAKSTPLRAHATTLLDRVAAERGLLPEQLDDLLAPDLGLDGDPIAYRGVSYDVELGVANDLVLRDPVRGEVTALPKPADDEEKALTSAWNSRRRKAKPVVADQIARLEEAMVVQRPWTVAEFRSRIAAHPLLGRLARRLVWALDDRLVGVDALGDLVDPAGALASDGAWVRIAHPAIDELAPWIPWLARRPASPPFEQVEREVFLDEDPSAYWQRSVEAAALYGLTRRGWHWGPSGRQALRFQLFRPFGAEGRVVLTIEPGTSAVLNPSDEPRQTITELSFESATGELGVFSDLPRVTRSELIRSLRALG
ncbi:DUF4132 domain-containing protein [Jatrophihabitans sp.]|uniref:DUF4132 domain-containing protein n=1 Tax=Jatrophihabitans sp. TaxID=1932789 RepID=UPI0030C748D2|nr:hypothetical protein [Jatrophihabitans sp.]